MHPIDHYATLRRGHEELLKRAEYERMARKARVKQKMRRNIRFTANWLGAHLVSLGEKLERFGAFTKRKPAPKTTKHVNVRSLSKLSPHN